MSIKQTAVAIFAAAAVVTGAAAVSTTAAEAGYGFKVKHHGFHHYKPWKFHYVHSCFWKTHKVWTYHGPIWVNKKVCY